MECGKGGNVRVRAGTTSGGIVVGLGFEGGEECGEAVFGYGFPWLDGSHGWSNAVGVARQIVGRW